MARLIELLGKCMKIYMSIHSFFLSFLQPGCVREYEVMRDTLSEQSTVYVEHVHDMVLCKEICDIIPSCVGFNFGQIWSWIIDLDQIVLEISYLWFFLLWDYDLLQPSLFTHWVSLLNHWFSSLDHKCSLLRYQFSLSKH